MKVYVVTAGEYSDYHIVGVTLDYKKAKDFAERNTGEYYYNTYRVEVYDTDKLEVFSEWMHYWCVSTMNEDLWATECDDSISYGLDEMNVVQKAKHIQGIRLYVYVVAEDEEHAMKIATDLFTKYQYRKKVDEYAGE